MTARRLSRLLPSLVVFAALLAAWQAAGSLFGVREYLLPGPLAVARAKHAIYRSLNEDLETMLAVELENQIACFRSRDVAQGLAAFREKRPPQFEGE